MQQGEKSHGENYGFLMNTIDVIWQLRERREMNYERTDSPCVEVVEKEWTNQQMTKCVTIDKLYIYLISGKLVVNYINQDISSNIKYKNVVLFYSFLRFKFHSMYFCYS